MNQELFCPNCENYRTTRRHRREETYTVRGQDITIPVESEYCNVCDARIGAKPTDQEIVDAVHAEYRRRHDLLTPNRIKEIRKRYRLSQKSFAALLGMSEATINRYEKGFIQEATHDTAIRACENPEVVKGLLSRRGDQLSDWQRERVGDALGDHAPPGESLRDRLHEINLGDMPREISEVTGFRPFDYQRFAAVTLWFCHRLRETSITTINKLLFYADFLTFKTSTVSLTGTMYRKAPYGPVPADYDAHLSLMEAQGLVIREERNLPNGYTGYYFKSGPKADSVAFSFDPHELRVLEHVAGQLGRLTAKQISQLSHDEAAWKQTEEGKPISYRFARQLSLSLADC